MSQTATLSEVSDAVRSGARTAVEVCRDALARIEAADPSLHAFNTVTAEQALARAAEVDRDRDRFRHAPLSGVPVALKDNICTRGVRTTASSRILETFVPPYDATVVSRLLAAGAVIVGKTNCDEFAMGSSTENSAFGPSHNPWALDRIPGGSSGGSAVAVAAGMAPLALGSETGGSIRQPAAMCGILGLKTTYGRVSRYGLLAFGSSLDQIGPLTRCARDSAIALGVIAGVDPADSTSASETVADYTAALTGDIRGTRVGMPSSLIDGVDPEIARAFKEALATLRARGATLVEIDLPHAKYAVPVYYLVATAEASSNLARYDGVRYGYRAGPGEQGPPTAGRYIQAAEPDPSRAGHYVQAGPDVQDDLRTMYSRTRERGFGAEVKRRIMLGTYVLSAGYYDAYYLKAQQVRTLILRDYDRAFERVDVVAMPTSPTPAFKIGERVTDPLQMYLGDVFTVSANLAGLPALSLPCGFTSDRLPIGLQLTGQQFDEATVLRIADGYERETEWWKQEPDA
jgi:aspartyl-tRNA(Asn)/glutamyl-tRNA(Gln) amidotransferase subunit A